MQWETHQRPGRLARMCLDPSVPFRGVDSGSESQAPIGHVAVEFKVPDPATDKCRTRGAAAARRPAAGIATPERAGRAAVQSALFAASRVSRCLHDLFTWKFAKANGLIVFQVGILHIPYVVQEWIPFRTLHMKSSGGMSARREEKSSCLLKTVRLVVIARPAT